MLRKSFICANVVGAFCNSAATLEKATGGKHPKTFDVALEGLKQDVEKHFSSVMTHVRGHSSEKASELTQSVARERYAKDLVTRKDFDEKPRVKTAKSSSLFAHGSVDIRSSRKNRGKRGGGGGGKDGDSKQWRRESLASIDADRDILQLDGAVPTSHGVAVAAAPADLADVMPHADITLDAIGTGLEDKIDAEKKASPMTDMLRERLMDLKAEKLTSNRLKTHLPRRLEGLLSDEALEELRVKDELARTAPKPAATPHKGREVLTLDEARAAALENLFLDKSKSAEDEQDKNMRRVTAEKILSEDLVPGSGSQDLLSRRGSSQASGVTESLAPDGSVSLARALSRAGFCSRHKAVQLITEGEVTLDGAVERNPFRLITAENDIAIVGHPSRLRFSPPRLWLYHKPSNVVVSTNDRYGRQLFNKHAAILGMDHIVPVGNLPTKAHGLMLLTNDGELGENLIKAQFQRTYHLRVRPAIDPILAQKINERGVTINGVVHKNVLITVSPATTSRFSVKVQYYSGEKALPITHLMQHLGRVIERGGVHSYGPFVLSGLAVGSIREVAIPQFLTDGAGQCWKPFIERDLPFFRKLRVLKLRKLSQFRELRPNEVDELNAYSIDELRTALAFDSKELSREAQELNDFMKSRPVIEEPDVPTSEASAVSHKEGISLDPSNFVEDDDVVRDVSVV